MKSFMPITSKGESSKLGDDKVATKKSSGDKRMDDEVWDERMDNDGVVCVYQ